MQALLGPSWAGGIILPVTWTWCGGGGHAPMNLVQGVFHSNVGSPAYLKSLVLATIVRRRPARRRDYDIRQHHLGVMTSTLDVDDWWWMTSVKHDEWIIFSPLVKYRSPNDVSLYRSERGGERAREAAKWLQSGELESFTLLLNWAVFHPLWCQHLLTICSQSVCLFAMFWQC